MSSATCRCSRPGCGCGDSGGCRYGDDDEDAGDDDVGGGGDGDIDDSDDRVDSFSKTVLRRLP